MSLFLDLLFPKSCVGCKKLGTYFCPECEAKIEYITSQSCPACSRPGFNGATHPRCKRKFTLDGVTAITRYKGPIRQAVHQIKYRLVKDEIITFANLMLKNLPPNFPNFDLIIPIPLHKKRQKERGFNQSFELAKIISKSLNIPLSEDVLLRSKATLPQFNLEGKQRRENIKDAFTCQNAGPAKNKRILLIDDVATTYSTLLEAGRTLKRNGASFVWALVLAHGK